MADCFAFLSETEGLALVTLEAAASGLPLILAEGHAAPGLLEPGVSGFAVPYDPPAIAAKLDALAADRDCCRQAGQASYERSLAFSWDRQAQEIESFILSTLADAVRRRSVGVSRQALRVEGDDGLPPQRRPKDRYSGQVQGGTHGLVDGGPNGVIRHAWERLKGPVCHALEALQQNVPLLALEAVQVEGGHPLHDGFLELHPRPTGLPSVTQGDQQAEGRVHPESHHLLRLFASVVQTRRPPDI
jgi:hypothetical protein